MGLNKKWFLNKLKAKGITSFGMKSVDSMGKSELKQLYSDVLTDKDIPERMSTEEWLFYIQDK